MGLAALPSKIRAVTGLSRRPSRAWYPNSNLEHAIPLDDRRDPAGTDVLDVAAACFEMYPVACTQHLAYRSQRRLHVRNLRGQADTLVLISVPMDLPLPEVLDVGTIGGTEPQTTLGPLRLLERYRRGDLLWDHNVDGARINLD